MRVSQLTTCQVYFRCNTTSLVTCLLLLLRVNGLTFSSMSRGYKLFRFAKQTSRSLELSLSSQSPFPAIPSMEQLSSDPFMKQVSYADFIVNVLFPEDNNRQTDVVMRRLRAQLSHSDGIRGFMVTFLTSNADDEGTSKPIPSSLMTVMQEIMSSDNDAAKNDFLMLACMNVIMPTGMVTMHEDPELSKQSQVTANNAITLLKTLFDEVNNTNNPLIQRQLEAILKVASSHAEGDATNRDVDDDVTYWETFFQEWGYKAEQKHDIAKAVQKILR